MDIRIQKNENLSLAIKKALVAEGAKKESFNGSIWNKILDVVDQQNQENKQNGEEALYSGGNTRKPADWQNNYKVVANQILKFSENAWNQIRALVGLGAKETVQTPEKLAIPNSESNTPQSLKPEQSTTFDLQNMARLNLNQDVPVTSTSVSNFIPRTKRTGAEPDKPTVQANPEKPATPVSEVTVAPVETVETSEPTVVNPETSQNPFVTKQETPPYIVDNEGNVISNLSDGGKVFISSTNLVNHYDSKSTEIRIVDKNGNEVKIPLALNHSVLSGLQGEICSERLQQILGKITQAVSELNPEELNDLKNEVKIIDVQNMILGGAAAYRSKAERIFLTTDTRNGLTSAALKHEIGHAVDSNVSAEFQTEDNKKDFDALFAMIKEKDPSLLCYGTTNSKEFFAEYYSSRTGGGLEETKKLLSYLENTQDEDLKTAYRKVKKICDGIIEKTRKKAPEERVSSSPIAKEHIRAISKSEYIENHRAEIKEIFGEEVSSRINSESDLYNFYNDYLNQNKFKTLEQKLVARNLFNNCPNV